MSLDSPAFLTCHPSTPCAAIRRFAVQVWRQGNKLALKYRLEGDIAALDIPPTSPPHRADGLWQNICCEAFIRGEGEGYYEFNFSPSTAWAGYHFTAYREGMALVDMIEPVKIAVLRDADWLELEATINLGGLPLAEEGKILLGLSAVIKAKHGGVSYWAIAHPAGKPDFHHPGSFVFEPGRVGKRPHRLPTRNRHNRWATKRRCPPYPAILQTGTNSSWEPRPRGDWQSGRPDAGLPPVLDWD